MCVCVRECVPVCVCVCVCSVCFILLEAGVGQGETFVAAIFDYLPTESLSLSRIPPGLPNNGP